MTFTFESWMRAVWNSIMEPSETARGVIGLNIPRNALWTALALVAVINVILLGLLQLFSPSVMATDGSTFAMSPFGYAAIIGIFLVLFVLGTHYVGQFFGGAGTIEATLAIVVWFQSVSLTLEAVQLVLVLISPAIGSMFGLLSLGALIWVFINFVNVLHGYNSLAKAVLTIILSLMSTALCAGILLAVLGIGPTGGL
ncbi:YIP1 family protein [Yoonia litorea]|uniref:Yip1 domain-containing protein n=1 Tax=Yoonia litorea TaxID=1123755 RepID=A0A1I6M0Q0_9RHOB|nr:YIP1 family protein [Yoonia litorea]SFS09265.1 Yip1 domain-containing protein [Yoonia litorea]